ncbi:MAG: ABC transporter ATP-binding protein [Ardenticatenaceae bacterium]|nr:ABC transporter ATP-binding protein [Ardenticatenaceae bacterium]MCB9443449.1 ABC transporter ATP-binding protein [Ardenticatenaceae bacterium]
MTQAITHSQTVSNDKPLLDVRNLVKHFPIGSAFTTQHVHALNGVSFAVRRGEVVALVGESGSGKSTTARLIVRLTPPTSGQIFLDGVDILKAEPRKASLGFRRRVQMIFQDPFGSLSPNHSIGYQLERPIIIHKRAQGKTAVREKVYELLEIAGLHPPHEMVDKFPFELSGGQRQRVSIARALAVEPEIIMADEPISMLDVSIRMGILNLIERLKEEKGIGFLYITHDLASARYIGDRTMVMYAGHIVESGESTRLMESPQHPYTQLLLAAVPNPKAGLTTKYVQARGEVPSLIDPPPGCPFAPRCSRVMEECRKTMPTQLTIEENHWVRCHLFTPDPTPSLEE